MAVTVTITTNDGKAYIDPAKVKIPRNSSTETFYRLLENYTPETKEETKIKTAE